MTGPPADAGDLHHTVDDGVATLWLNRPAKRNAVTYEMWRGIAALCEQLADDRSVRLLVVRGAGDHFCAGADIAGFGAAHPAAYRAANEAADEALATFPKPTLAVVQGACVGGGTEVAIACDVRLAATTARFGITPARLGIVYPAAATRRAVQTIGPAATKHLLYSAELIDCDRALRIGLVDEAHAPDALDARVAELSHRLARERSLLTQMASKEIVDAATRGEVDPAVVARWDEETARSPDTVEGVTAFLERRTPHFTWDGPSGPPSGPVSSR